VDPYLEVNLELTKAGDALTFDFTGSSQQTSAAENMGIVGTMSSAMNPLIAMLCHDLPWNEGLFRVVDFIVPEGTIINPIRPAAISANVPSGANVLVLTTAQNALSQMCLTSDAYRAEACGYVGAAFNFPVLAGEGRAGFFATLVMDGLAGGVGGGPSGDGESTAQNPWCVKNMIANVETTELLFPILYLWRRQVTDSGGAGRHRGGLGLEDAFTPWGTAGFVHVNVGCGRRPRNCLGLSGGYPASHTPIGVIRATSVREACFEEGRLPRSLADLLGTDEALAPKGVTQIAEGDVLHGFMSSGGGGFGDPIERTAGAVQADVAAGAVSRAVAERVYGVVLDEHGQLDVGETDRRREEIRNERLEKGARNAQGA
jgi:N-methylhydantoinase B